MTKVTSLTPFFFLLCFSCIISLCLSRPISDAAAANFGEQHWFMHPWLFANAPMPSGGFKWPMPVKHWPYYAQGPMPSGGFKWPVPVKHWPFYAQGPIPEEGWKWWPKEEVVADVIDIEEAATVAAPPLAG